MQFSLAPIVLFVYNRPEETRQTIAALQRNLLAEQSDLFVFSDAPKKEEYEEKVKEVRDVVRSISGFKRVTLVEAERNKGLANSVIDGVSRVIQQYGRVIVLEDDLITSPNFLSYMNQSLNHYERNEKVISITGLTFDVAIPPDYSYDVYFTRRMCSYGWGTWLDRWEKIDWAMTDYGAFRYNLKENLRFMRGGEDLPRMLGAYMKGKIDSWAVRFAYHQYKTNTYTAYPVRSLVDNIGFEGTGTNTVRKKRYDTIDYHPSDNTVFQFPSDIVINKIINKRFLRKHRTISRIIANYLIR